MDYPGQGAAQQGVLGVLFYCFREQLMQRSEKCYAVVHLSYCLWASQLVDATGVCFAVQKHLMVIYSRTYIFSSGIS